MQHEATGGTLAPVPRLHLLLVLVMLLLGGCKHFKPPYPRGQEPPAESLLQVTKPKIDAIVVSDARIVANRFARADLAMLAQAPARFRGTVNKGGNELVTLAFNEEGYGLRYKLDAIPTGFYEGPPSPCAVQFLTGTEMSYEALVAAVLGGGPVLEAPFDIIEQRWNDDEGHEEVTIANPRFIEELRFVWRAGAWQFRGATLWERAASGGKGRRLWKLEHEDYGNVGGVVLPGKTKIEAASANGNDRIVITYKSRDLNPAWARAPVNGDAADQGDDGATTETPWAGDDGGWEGEDAGWEGDDGGWETEGEEPSPAPEPPENEPPQGEPRPPSEKPQAPTPPKRARIPEVFFVQPDGLPRRGDVCRGR